RLDARPRPARLPPTRAGTRPGPALPARLRPLRAPDHALRRVPGPGAPRVPPSLLPAAALARAPPLRRRPRRLVTGLLLARLADAVRRRGGEGPHPPLRRPAARRVRALGARAHALLPLRVEHDLALVRLGGRLPRLPVCASLGGRTGRHARCRQ